MLSNANIQELRDVFNRDGLSNEDVDRLIQNITRTASKYRVDEIVGSACFDDYINVEHNKENMNVKL